MTTDSRVRYVRAPLYPKQEEALFNPARYGVTEASTKSGKTVAQFKTALSGVEGAGRVYPASVTGGKEVRAFHFASSCNDRRVSVIEADWNHEFFSELDDFPEGDKDDQVDAAAHAFNHLAPNLKPRIRWL